MHCNRARVSILKPAHVNNDFQILMGKVTSQRLRCLRENRRFRQWSDCGFSLSRFRVDQFFRKHKGP